MVLWLVPRAWSGLCCHGVAPAAQPGVTAGHRAEKIPGKAPLGPAEGQGAPLELQPFPSDTCRAPQAGEKWVLWGSQAAGCIPQARCCHWDAICHAENEDR